MMWRKLKDWWQRPPDDYLDFYHKQMMMNAVSVVLIGISVLLIGISLSLITVELR